MARQLASVTSFLEYSRSSASRAQSRCATPPCLRSGDTQSHSWVSTPSHGAHVRAPGVVQEGHGGAPSMMEERAAASAFVLTLRTNGAIFFFFRSCFSYSKPPSEGAARFLSELQTAGGITSIHCLQTKMPGTRGEGSRLAQTRNSGNSLGN